MASIRKRGPYQWEVRIRRKGWPVQCATFPSKADAATWAREIEGEMDRGRFISRKEAESTILDEALDRYIAEYIPNLAHPQKEINRAKRIREYTLAKRSLASIRSKHIQNFIRERENEGVKNSTIRLDLALISRLFEVAASDWGMEALRNPVKRTTKPKLPKGRERRLIEKVINENGEMVTEEELLLDHCSERLRPIVRFALETAMRREEIASLIWRKVDLDRRNVFLEETKNGEVRSVPLSPQAIAILKEQQPKTEKFPSDRVFELCADRITKSFRKACKKASINNLRFHDLRHEATSRLFENTDLDIMEIKSITGHKSMQILSRYSHLRTHRLADRLAGKKRGRF